MILQLQQNVPMGPIIYFRGVITIYVKQYGAGNLRLGMNREDLVQGINLAPGAIVDGIPQAAADNGGRPVQYFWSGSLWLISDAAGPVMVLAPAYTAYIDRLKAAQQPSDFLSPSEDEGDLSTYRNVFNR
jgi:hypothetical protein